MMTSKMFRSDRSFSTAWHWVGRRWEQLAIQGHVRRSEGARILVSSSLSLLVTDSSPCQTFVHTCFVAILCFVKKVWRFPVHEVLHEEMTSYESYECSLPTMSLPVIIWQEKFFSTDVATATALPHSVGWRVWAPQWVLTARALW